jgi:hypothetical protein
LNAELLHRREVLLGYMAKDLKLKYVVEEMTKDIADPYERQKQINVLRKDWSNRVRWMFNVVRLKDGTYLPELVAGMNEAMGRCWTEYARGDNTSSRVGALRTIIGGKSRVGLLLMKAGIIQMAPQQIESTVTLSGTPFDVDPELKKALLDEAERQRLEKEKQNVKP